MNESSEEQPKSWLAAKWAIVAAVLGALVLLIDFMTKSIGLFGLFVGPATPVVVATEVPFENSSSCLEFAFSSLPANFALKEIRLDIIDSKGPNDISGDMASSVLERTVNFEVSPPYLVGQQSEIVVRAPVQATQSEDAFFLHWCPTLAVPGTSGSLTVVPNFFDSTGKAIEDLEIRTASGSSVKQGISVALVRPPNERVTLVDRLQGLLPK